MMLFFQKQYEYLISSQQHKEKYCVSQFSNQELLLKLSTTSLDKKCLVIGSMTASCQEQLELLLLIHTLRESGVDTITLFSPYLGYQRQDTYQKGLSQGLLWANTLTYAAGVTSIVTIDQHTLNNQREQNMPIINLEVEYIFYQKMLDFVQAGFSFIFPDKGACLRYAWILEKFHGVDYGFFIKKRFDVGIRLEEFEGKFGRKVIIYDDILDSGETLLQTCIALRQLGVEEIVIFVTHAFFQGQIWLELFHLGVRALYCTNSLPSAQKIQMPSIHVFSINIFLQNLL